MFASLLVFNQIVRCINGWQMFRNACYKFSNEKKNWDKAEKACNEFGAHLVSIHSQEEADFTRGLLNRTSIDQWTGGLRNGTGWRWTDGTTFDFTYWLPEQPSNQDGRQNCITNTGYNGVWYAELCENEHKFLCKKQHVGGTLMKRVEYKK